MALIKQELLKHYGTTNANAVKLKIIWDHLQALMNVHYSCDRPGTHEHKKMQLYKKHWQWCERKKPQ